MAAKVTKMRVRLRGFSSASSPVALTTEGPVRGFVTTGAFKCDAWKGIPYAAPPIGPLRWKAPRHPTSHEGRELVCTAAGPESHQLLATNMAAAHSTATVLSGVAMASLDGLVEEAAVRVKKSVA